LDGSMLDERISLYNQQYKERDFLYHDIAQKANISEAAFWILYIICGTKNTYSQSDICREWLYPKQTVNSAITKMCKDGLLNLVPDKNVGNRKVLCLTSTGREFCDHWILPVMEADKVSFSSMTEEEQELYLKLTQKQLDYFKEQIVRLMEE